MEWIVPKQIRSLASNSIVSWGHSFLFDSFFPKLKRGQVSIDILDVNYTSYCTAKPMVFGDKDSLQKASIIITDLYNFTTKVLFAGDIGFSEAYILGYFNVDDMKNLLVSKNEMDGLDSKWAFLKHGVDRLYHIYHNNSVSGAKENIRAHYDLSNDMFSLFLDPTMSYSSAIFAGPDESLEDAQMRKIRKLIDKANLSSNHHLLEIGSGWGALAMEAVRRTGCRVTTVSLSIEQVNLAQERIREAGLQDRIDVQLIDYRHITDKYDRIISCEMIEAVGHEHYPEFFQAIERLLKPDGLFVIQFISFNDQRYDTYRKGCDFIQKYIFPGGLCPSITSIVNASTSHSNLMLEHLENYGPHYAITLNRWKQNLLTNRSKVLALPSFDEQFIRMFNYYFCYCEAAFETRTINLLQMVFSRSLSLLYITLP
ncbi:cyclopropane fatty acid synthase [Heterostelium album PN500]|uniref:Cyclopropane fatty acid synthase n=1 Tax=Heterostelium pallidum (strain ATCC 26659 / Pp 5 / PN500) TaxID=670386 RepID=D3BGE7_HETP5|nr:cyclopropane fatty acid synthase [Heterostelium album PN500]EFA79547.1 cyclopropane fatty acid synthase [Heterostelium album PN500]|eukprot:XP_020431668.1 cyclopropane fatty acid synthase [Heterostelium album PN500]